MFDGMCGIFFGALAQLFLTAVSWEKSEKLHHICVWDKYFYLNVYVLYFVTEDLGFLEGMHIAVAVLPEFKTKFILFWKEEF